MSSRQAIPQRMIRATVVALVATVAVGLCPPAARAKTYDAPVAVGVLAGYNAVKADIAYVGKLADNPDLAVGLEALLKLMTSNKGLEGLDLDRPWVLAIFPGDTEEETGGCLYLPVTDAKALAAALQPYIGDREKVEDGIFKFSPAKGDPFYVFSQGQWLKIGPKIESVKLGPDTPEKLIPASAKGYDISLTIDLRNLPPGLLEKAKAKMRKDAQKDLARKPHESETEHFIRKTLIEGVLSCADTLISDTEMLVYGATLDAEAQQAYLDSMFVAKKGSKLAKELAALDDQPSRFTSIALPDATFSAHVNSTIAALSVKSLTPLSDAIRKSAKEELEGEDKPEEEKQIIRKLIDAGVDVAHQTLGSGRLNAAFSARLKPDAVTLLAGGYLAETEKAEEAVNTVIAIAIAEKPELGSIIKTDTGEYKGVRLHEAHLPIGEDEDNREAIVRAVGEKLDVTVGFGEQGVYAAAGRDGAKVMKKAIAGSLDQPKPTIPAEATLSVLSLMEFVAEAGEKEKERADAARAVEILKKVRGKDHVRMTVTPIDRGLRTRILFEEGLLRLLGAAASGG